MACRVSSALSETAGPVLWNVPGGDASKPHTPVRTQYTDHALNVMHAVLVRKGPTSATACHTGRACVVGHDYVLKTCFRCLCVRYGDSSDFDGTN